jgi:hypothetical protein
MSIWLKAAEKIVKGETHYSCLAIDRAAGEYVDTHARHKKYQNLFMPKNQNFISKWWGKPTPEAQLARSLALCLMHEIYKKKGRKNARKSKSHRKTR